MSDSEIIDPPKKRHPRTVLVLLAVLILSLGLGVGVYLVKQEQDKRSKAFTGYSTPKIDVADTLKFARPGDVPLRDDLISDQDARGLFYTFAKQFSQISHLEYQKVSDPRLFFRGKVFLFYDEALDKTYIFSRIENLPFYEGKFMRLWLESDIEQRTIPLSIGKTSLEDDVPVTYHAFMEDGDLRREGKGLMYSYDKIRSVPPKAPENVVLNVHF